MLLKLYQLLTTISGPFIILYLYYRKKQGKEDPTRFNERLGAVSVSRPSGPLVWIHAASVGESLSVLPFIDHIHSHYPDYQILMTTGTVSSANIIASRLPDKAFHQYVPIDRIQNIRRFLKHWRPNLAFWVESELWPNLIHETSNTCPMILLNGRMSDRSYTQWRRYKALGKTLMECFSLVLPQSEMDGRRFKELGAKDLHYAGNLKYSAPPLPADPKALGELLNLIKERPVWLAASTHPGEERLIAKTHQQLKEDHPNLLSIIVPRHAKRRDDIATILEECELQYSIRSAQDTITDETAIYLADTMGELGIFYRLCPIVFIGGSLVPHGGQNPLEPARLECAIVVGPHMENFQEITQNLRTQEGLITIQDQPALYTTINELLHEPSRQEDYAQHALESVEQKANALDKSLETITPFLERISN